MQLYFPQASSDLEGISHRSDKRLSEMGMSPARPLDLQSACYRSLSSKIRALLEGPNAGNSNNHPLTRNLAMTTYIPSLTLPAGVFAQPASSILVPVAAGMATGFLSQRKPVDQLEAVLIVLMSLQSKGDAGHIPQLEAASLQASTTSLWACLDWTLCPDGVRCI